MGSGGRRRRMGWIFWGVGGGGGGGEVAGGGGGCWGGGGGVGGWGGGGGGGDYEWREFFGWGEYAERRGVVERRRIGVASVSDRGAAGAVVFGERGDAFAG